MGRCEIGLGHRQCEMCLEHLRGTLVVSRAGFPRPQLWGQGWRSVGSHGSGYRGARLSLGGWCHLNVGLRTRRGCCGERGGELGSMVSCEPGEVSTCHPGRRSALRGHRFHWPQVRVRSGKYTRHKARQDLVLIGYQRCECSVLVTWPGRGRGGKAQLGPRLQARSAMFRL